MTAAKPLHKLKSKPRKTKVRSSNKKKLTLSLDQEIIERGKFFAKENGMSLSALIEQFLLEKTKEREVYVPVRVIEPDPELGALFPPNPQHSYENIKSKDQLMGEYYDAISNRVKVEEE